MDYIAFCRNYFDVTKIPVSLLKSGYVAYSSIAEHLSIEPQTFWQMWPSEQNPEFCYLSPDIEYGRVTVENTDYEVILGPVFNLPLTEEVLREYMREQALSLECREIMAEYLYTIPLISHRQLARHLNLIHLCLNHKVTNADDLYKQDTTLLAGREEQHLQQLLDNQENENLHNSYYFEMELYQYIRDGSEERLKEFLSADRTTPKEGKMASTPLRHAKNLFISAAVKAGMLGAIPGGMDIEKAYQLIDLYIQECEQLSRIEAIHTLQYSMLMDFCRRAGESRIPEGISSEVYVCMNYIRSHTNEPISLEDVAAQISRSISYITKRFKTELGINVGAFITRCRLEEAKSLLTHSNKSLAEISSYLCFSSQAYFQNVFKKKYGITPMQYRKQGRRL